MIYLIGGPPKCGKTTLAKEFSKIRKIPWVSTDSLQNIIKPYISEDNLSRDFPASAQRGDTNDEKYSRFSTNKIIDAYQKQAQTLKKAIEMFVLCEIADENDYIIEGYHIEPKFVSELQKNHPQKIKGTFVIKTDPKKLFFDIQKSSTPNDWILKRTQNKETYAKISKMICEYGKYFELEAKKYNSVVFKMDDDFNTKIKEIINFFTR